MPAKPERDDRTKHDLKQRQLSLTYSVGDWVWVKAHGNNLRQMVARIESAAPINSAAGEVWLVRCYYSPSKRVARPGWSTTSEHRRVLRSLNAAELTDLRNAGTIPAAGSEIFS